MQEAQKPSLYGVVFLTQGIFLGPAAQQDNGDFFGREAVLDTAGVVQCLQLGTKCPRRFSDPLQFVRPKDPNFKEVAELWESSMKQVGADSFPHLRQKILEHMAQRTTVGIPLPSPVRPYP